MTQKLSLQTEASARLDLRTQVVKQIDFAINGGQQVIRAYNDGWKHYKNQCESQGLPLKGENSTLGDVDAQGFDSEPEFGHLSHELGIYPDAYRQVREIGTNLYEKYYRETKSISGYQGPFGLPETRKALADFATRWTGVEFITTDNTFFSAGGGSRMIDTTLQVISLLLKDQKVLQSVFSYYQPSYSPVIAMAKEQGWQLNGKLCPAEQNYFFNPDTVVDIARQSNLAYIVVINNPTSVMINPQQLENSIKAMQQANPNMMFLVDMAYITTIEKSTAHQLMNVFNNKEVFAQSVLITSLSKSHASPGFRFGASHTGIKDFADVLNIISSQVNPSCPVSSMMDAYGLLSYTEDDMAVIQTAKLYAQRRTVMISVLQQINRMAKKEIFTQLGNLTADGGLYIYPQLAEGLDALELFKQTGLLGINGACFEDDPQNRRIRLSIGKLTTDQIESIPENLDYTN